MSHPPALLEIHWPLPRGVRAAFTTRLGGHSRAPWDSFNLAAHVGDDASHVALNRARLRELLELRNEPAWLEQVHGATVANADVPFAGGPPVQADAAVASHRDVACVIMVADCLPVLFASRDGAHVGAAHAGWRGLAAGVLENTVAALGVPAHELSAWLGPAILQPHFEVGADVRDAFLASDAGATDCFAPNQRGRWQADLVGLARRRLAAIGVRDVHGGSWCTFADPERFFSHRRDGRGGRMAALVWRHG
ncbi:MAG TPA: peptidoglycan editing factor PgeF [Steroidobacteraceae bacterium]|nr:peptidoglycan editing factor PgeF [Steroidobacteraceae bacterium]